jgi:hypothetical protein
MIYDCFTFFNELDVLEIRLSVLYKHVDYFVIVEANKSWRLTLKDFVFEQNKERYKDFIDKIIYIKVTDLPDNNDPWKMEESQRNCIVRGLNECDDNDLIIISDVDEIWDPRITKESFEIPSRIQMPFYYYNLNYRVNQLWDYPVICYYSNLKEHTPNFYRQEAKYLPVNQHKANDFSFHLSFLYGNNYKWYSEKIENYNHVEYDKEIFKHPNHIRFCIKYGIDIFLRKNIKLKYVKNKQFLKLPVFNKFSTYYHKRSIFYFFPFIADVKAYMRILFYRYNPHISYSNSIITSIQFILKKKMKKNRINN